MSLIHWWPLNGDLKDYGVLNNNLSNSNAQIDNSGKIGKCYSFTYTSHQYMAFSDSSFMNNYINNHSFSIAYWTKAGSSVSRLCAIGLSYGVRIYNSTPIFGLYNTTRNATVRASVSITDGNWHHVCATYNIIDNSMKIYIDGVLSGSNTYPSGTYSSSWNNGQYIGYDPNNNTDDCWYDGKLNDVRIYDHALSAKEVKEISKGLVLHYDFNDPYVEGTTNLADQNWYTRWDNSGSGTINLDDTSIPASPTGTKIFSNIQTVEGQSAFGVGITDSLPSKTITASCWFYKSGSPNSNTIGPLLRGWDPDAWYVYLSYNGNTNFREWPSDQWLYITGTTTTNSNQQQVYICCYTGGLNEKFAFSGWQIEEKDHATPYVNGTRSAGKVYDCSGYGYNGNVSGNLQILKESYKGNYCAKFDSNVYVDIIKELPNFSEGTFSFWINIGSNNAQAYRDIFSKKNNLYNGLWISLNTESRGLWAYQGDNSPSYCKAGDFLNANTWVYCSFVFKTNVGMWYLNGVQIGTSVTYTGHNYITGGSYALGDAYTGTSFDGAPFIGKIADFKIYATALSASDVLAEYQRKAAIDKNGNLYAGQFIEENIIPVIATKNGQAIASVLKEGESKVQIFDGYKRLEYIESNGSQAIDTGVKLDMDNGKVEIVFQATTASQTGMVLANSSGNYWWLYHYSSLINCYLDGTDGGQQNLLGPARDTNKHTAIYQNKTYYVDNTKYGTATGNLGLTSGNLFMFKWSASDTSYPYKGKIYACKIWSNNSTLVRDFIPAKRKSDNIIGVLDIVNNVFYTNAGTGTFTAGPELGELSIIKENNLKEI